MFFCQGGNFRIIAFVFFSWISIYIRLIKKTNGAYIEKGKEEQAISNDSTMSSNGNVKVSYGIRELNLK